MRKSKALIKYNLIGWGNFLKWLLIWLIGFNLLFVIIGLFTHGFSMEGAVGGWGALGSQLLRTVEGVVIMMALVYGLVSQYSEFKVAIHAGVSRGTMWLAHMATLLVFVISGWLLWVIADAVDHGLTDHVGYTLVGLGLVAFTFNALGSLFALFSRLGKIILACCLVAGLVFLVVLLARIVVYTQDFWRTLIITLSKMGMTGLTALGWGVMVVWLALMVWMSYLCSKHLQLRRD